MDINRSVRQAAHDIRHASEYTVYVDDDVIDEHRAAAPRASSLFQE